MKHFSQEHLTSRLNSGGDFSDWACGLFSKLVEGHFLCYILHLAVLLLKMYLNRYIVFNCQVNCDVLFPEFSNRVICLWYSNLIFSTPSDTLISHLSMLYVKKFYQTHRSLSQQPKSLKQFFFIFQIFFQSNINLSNGIHLATFLNEFRQKRLLVLNNSW